MQNKLSKLLFTLLAAMFLVLLAAGGLFQPTATNGLHLKGRFGTATPNHMIWNEGTGNVSFEVRNNEGTPVHQIQADGDVIVTGREASSPGTTITSTGELMITPTNRTYLVAPLDLLTVTLAITDAIGGQSVLIVNTVTTNTVIADTGATVGGGDLTLGQYDNATFTYVGGVWVQTGNVDNN